MDTVTATATQAVAEWFESAEMKPQLDTLVQAWNVHDLLGIDLADQLREVVTAQLHKANLGRVSLGDVDWNFLAEKYADEICGVDEDELLRRLKRHER